MDLSRALGWLPRNQYRTSPRAKPQALTIWHTPEYVTALAEAEADQAVSGRGARAPRPWDGVEPGLPRDVSFGPPPPPALCCWRATCWAQRAHVITRWRHPITGFLDRRAGFATSTTRCWPGCCRCAGAGAARSPMSTSTRTCDRVEMGLPAIRRRADLGARGSALALHRRAGAGRRPELLNLPVRAGLNDPRWRDRDRLIVPRLDGVLQQSRLCVWCSGRRGERHRYPGFRLS